jgi:SAM-dependent methyltransferase
VVGSLKRKPATRKAISFLRSMLAGNRPVGLAGGHGDWIPVPAEPAAVSAQLVGIPRYDPSAVPLAGLNRILDQAASRSYRPAIDYLFQYMPETMSRKIAAANVQQAFVLDTVVRLVTEKNQPAILSIGSYEDTAAGCLLRSGYLVEELDPLLNYDLATYMTKPTCRRSTFDVVFATSVIEHVSEDGQFLKDIEELLAPGGVGVLTCDFNDKYRPGDRIPSEDRRLYTRRDILDRLMPLIPRCELIDSPNWECIDPDFVYGGCRYTFASLVFRRVS